MRCDDVRPFSYSKNAENLIVLIPLKINCSIASGDERINGRRGYARYFNGSLCFIDNFLLINLWIFFLGQVVGETYANEKHRQTLRIRLQNDPICQKLLRVSPWNSLQTLNLVLCTFRSSWVSCECRVLNLVRRLRVWHKINQRVFWFLGRHNISQLIEKIFPFIRSLACLFICCCHFMLTKRIHIIISSPSMRFKFLTSFWEFKISDRKNEDFLIGCCCEINNPT